MNNKSLPIILIVIGCLLTAGGVHHSHQMDAKLARINTTLDSRKQVLKHYQAKAENPLLSDKVKTPAQKSTQTQLNTNNEMFKATNGFFSVAFNFSSQKEWNQRKNNARRYATDDVLNDKKLFNSGKDITGNSIIEAQKVVSTFNSVNLSTNTINNNEHSLTGLAKVSYSASTDNHSPAQHTDIYLLKYDLHQHKLSLVHRIGELSSEDN